MKKPKFNIEIFFESFAKINLPKYIIARPHMLFDYALSKGFGYEEEKDYNSGRDWIDTDYSLFENPKKSFNNLSKLLEYTPLIQTIDNDPEGVFISKEEFGYLSSKKSNISFLISSSFYHGDGHSWEEPKPLTIFKKFDNKKIKELPKILLNSLKKTIKNQGIYFASNLVNLNNKFIWDKKLLEIAFKEDLKKRKKVKKNGFITDNLYLSGLRAGIDKKAINEMIAIFSFSVDFQRDIWRNDNFEIFYFR